MHGQLAYNRPIEYDGEKILSTIKSFPFSPCDRQHLFLAFLMMPL